VIRQEASKLLLIERLIVSIAAQRIPNPNRPLVGENVRDWNFRGFIHNLNSLAERATAMGFARTVEKSEALILLVRNMLSSDFPKYPEYIEEIKKAYEQDTRGLIIFLLDPDKQRYEAGTFINADVHRCFPTSAKEIIEAGKCLVCDRNTACVFHALRSLEIPLKVIAKSLKIKLADNAKGKNWHFLISQIEAALNLLSKEKKDRVQHTLSYLSNIRGPLRNATMHLDKSYNAEEAKDILDTVCIFFKYIPKHLFEIRDRKSASVIAASLSSPVIALLKPPKIIAPSKPAIKVKSIKKIKLSKQVKLYTVSGVLGKKRCHGDARRVPAIDGEAPSQGPATATLISAK
jgi:hypothetical protein